MEEKNIGALIVEAKIQWIKRTCNLIMFDLLDKNDYSICLHVECFMKIIKDNKIIACTNDMYTPGENCHKKKFKWDKPGTSLFDETLQANLKEVVNKRINEVKIQNNELYLHLENNVIIEIIPDSVTDSEAYILFSKDKTFFLCCNP